MTGLCKNWKQTTYPEKGTYQEMMAHNFLKILFINYIFCSEEYLLYYKDNEL